MSEDRLPHQLATARDCVERLARDHANVTANMAAYAMTGAGAGVDPAGSVEWTQVEAQAMRRIASQVNRYQNFIEAATRALLEADTIRGLIVTVNVDTTRASVEARCDGWDDPTCERNGIANVWINGHNHWLCQRCWDRHRQAKRRDGVTSA